MKAQRHPVDGQCGLELTENLIADGLVGRLVDEPAGVGPGYRSLDEFELAGGSAATGWSLRVEGPGAAELVARHGIVATTGHVIAGS